MLRHSDGAKTGISPGVLGSREERQQGSDGLVFVYQQRPQRQPHHRGRSTSAAARHTAAAAARAAVREWAPRWSGANG